MANQLIIWKQFGEDNVFTRRQLHVLEQHVITSFSVLYPTLSQAVIGVIIAEATNWMAIVHSIFFSKKY